MLQIARIEGSQRNKKCLLYVVKHSVLCLSEQKKYIFFCPCQKKLVLLHPLSRDSKPRWWNWQTRYFEGVVAVGRCKFKSCPGHRKGATKVAFFYHQVPREGTLPDARVAELVDAHVSGACSERSAGSSPVPGTKEFCRSLKRRQLQNSSFMC